MSNNTYKLVVYLCSSCELNYICIYSQKASVDGRSEWVTLGQRQYNY